MSQSNEFDKWMKRTEELDRLGYYYQRWPDGYYKRKDSDGSLILRTDGSHKSKKSEGSLIPTTLQQKEQIFLENPHLVNPKEGKQHVETEYSDIHQQAVVTGPNIEKIAPVVFLADYKWKKFFKDYLAWIIDNMQMCLNKIPTPINLDALQKLPFDKGGFDERFSTSGTTPTDAEKKKLQHIARLYDDFFETLKHCQVLGSFKRKILTFLCEAITARLRVQTEKYVFYSKMIFYMEIMVCNDVFILFMSKRNFGRRR